MHWISSLPLRYSLTLPALPWFQWVFSSQLSKLSFPPLLPNWSLPRSPFAFTFCYHHHYFRSTFCRWIKNMYYLAFLAWSFHLMMIFIFIHFLTGDILFFLWLNNTSCCVCVYIQYFLYSLISCWAPHLIP
jgi:hypothetical protein